MESVKDRILQFIERTGISKRDFERKIGASNGFLNSMDKCPSTKKLYVIFDTFKQLNQEWLLNGVGDMLNSGYSEQSVRDDVRQIRNTENESEEITALKQAVKELTAQLHIKDKQIDQLLSICQTRA